MTAATISTETTAPIELNPEILFRRFVESEMLEEFAEAFEEATNLPLKLEDAAHAKHILLTENDNKVCETLENTELTNQTCSACHARMHRLAEAAPVTTSCYYGLQVHISPIKCKDKTFAYLSTNLLSGNLPAVKLQTNLENLLKQLGAKSTTLDKACHALEDQIHIPIANNPNKVFAWLDTFADLASNSAPGFAQNFDKDDD